MRDFKAQFSEAAMRIPKGDALRPSELFKHLEALKKSFQLNIKRKLHKKLDTIEATYCDEVDDAFSEVHFY